MMDPNAIQIDLVVVEYQPLDIGNTMITLAFDFSYTVVGHVHVPQVHGAVGTEYVGRQFWQKVSGEYQHLDQRKKNKNKPVSWNTSRRDANETALLRWTTEFAHNFITITITIHRQRRPIAVRTTHLGLVGQVREHVQAPFRREPRARAVDRVQLLSVVRRLAAVARAQLGPGAPGQLRGRGRRHVQRRQRGHGHHRGGCCCCCCFGGGLGHGEVHPARTGLAGFRAGTDDTWDASRRVPRADTHYAEPSRCHSLPAADIPCGRCIREMRPLNANGVEQRIILSNKRVAGDLNKIYRRPAEENCFFFFPLFFFSHQHFFSF